MANHEFGIMQNQPMNKERFDEYEPNKYDCIVVDDNFIEPILTDLLFLMHFLVVNFLILLHLPS